MQETALRSCAWNRVNSNRARRLPSDKQHHKREEGKRRRYGSNTWKEKHVDFLSSDIINDTAKCVATQRPTMHSDITHKRSIWEHVWKKSSGRNDVGLPHHMDILLMRILQNCTQLGPATKRSTTRIQQWYEGQQTSTTVPIMIKSNYCMNEWSTRQGKRICNNLFNQIIEVFKIAPEQWHLGLWYIIDYCDQYE